MPPFHYRLHFRKSLPGSTSVHCWLKVGWLIPICTRIRNMKIPWCHTPLPLREFGFCPLSACISFFFFPESTPRLLGIFFWQPCMCLCVAQCWKNCGSVEAHLLITEMLFARRRTSAFDQRSRDGDRQVRGGLRKIRPFLIHFTNFLKVMSHFFSVFLLVFYSRIY